MCLIRPRRMGWPSGRSCSGFSINRAVADRDIDRRYRVSRSRPARAGIARILGNAQQLHRVTGPLLAGGLKDIDQFAQMVRIAQCVLAVIFTISLQAVMHCGPGKARQDIECGHGIFAAFGVRPIPRQTSCGGAGHPHQSFAMAQPRFIEMQHCLREQGCFNLHYGRDQCRPLCRPDQTWLQADS